MYKIKKSAHYTIRYERDFPFEEVEQFVKTVKGKKIGENLIKYEKRTKKKTIYVLCAVDRRKNLLKIINAKKALKKQ